VCLAALDDDSQLVSRGEHAAGAVEQRADGAREDVEAEDGVGARLVERAFAQHQLGPAFLAGRRALFGGLEEKLHRARELVLEAAEHLRDAHEYRHVVVVAAGVHDADLLAVVLGADLGGERQIDLFGDREGVHVCP